MPAPPSRRSALDELTGMLRYEPKCEFEVGDVVRLRTGSSPQRVVQVLPARATPTGRWMEPRLLTKYLSSGHDGYDYRGKPRPASQYIHVETPERASEKEKKVTTKLYQTKDGKFGTYLATDSSGRLVLEMKGSGEAAAYPVAEVEEVRPYTVKVTCLSDETLGGKSRAHFEATKGSVEKGDLVLTPQGRILQVLELDTKAEPDGRLEGRRLVTEPLREVSQ